MQSIPVSQAQRDLTRVLDTFTPTGPCVLTDAQQLPVAVILSWPEFSSMMETLHLLSSPANVAHLANSMAQHQQGLPLPARGQ